MKTDAHKTIYLKDYRPYPYELKSVDLNFDLHQGYSIVTSRLEFKKRAEEDLFLHGEDLELVSIFLDDAPLDDYRMDDKGLTIPCPSGVEFTLEIVTKIFPETNTRLEGLYKSGGNYCTQCEAEGFRRITYFPDRPDVMSVYTVRIEADKDQYPVLLSNGNKAEEGTLSGGRHFTLWHDPHPKPCYLFALVAGNLNHIHDSFTTRSGRKVDLFIYVRPGDEDQCDHAMDSLKRSMKWDEDVYGLEYDLDLFNIVAVSDFNMGAMENKSLNIFNTALVLAHQNTATDSDFFRVESVIAHEYFHNWSGNRVTCRDWFQLSLKEGLTVFRDQEFSADTHSRIVQRIDDVSHLRRLQFPEDAGPLAHPIRPDNYIEINNFYTMTVYEKGAEVIRMMRTLLGAETYRKATDLYFERHDGEAATCDDFVQAMQDASGMDFSQFKLWYSQAGTPEITFDDEYDASAKAYKITLKQNVPDTPGQTNKKPMLIPVAIGLVGADGRDLKDETVLRLEREEQSFTFEGISEKPVPSIFRGFSAPVNLKTRRSADDLMHLMRFDADGFNRWEAGQELAHIVISDLYSGAIDDVPDDYLDAIGAQIDLALDDNSDKAFAARMLGLPDLSAVIQRHELADPPALYKIRQKLLAAIKRTHKPSLQKLYKANAPDGEFKIDAAAMGRRALRNAALTLLTCTYGSGCTTLSLDHYDNADNMTDRVAALNVLTHIDREPAAEAFHDFYNRFKNYELVIDKWFSLQAVSTKQDIIQSLKSLRQHNDFNIKNPNRVRSLYGAFAMNNPSIFHSADGSGYEFLADAIIELNAINPQIGARLLGPFRAWKNYSKDRQDMMRAQLERILASENIAPDIYEIASKSLKA